jgi:hypothetical protein
VNWTRHGMRVNFKRSLRPRPFNHGASMLDASPFYLSFLDTELSRFEACDACEQEPNYRFVSRMHLALSN